MVSLPESNEKCGMGLIGMGDLAIGSFGIVVDGINCFSMAEKFGTGSLGIGDDGMGDFGMANDGI